jgi:23S rRNA (pseudouridine1915-N3)-methyltransferase
MKLTIIAVGTRMPDWVLSAWDDYAKRFPADWSLNLKEIKPEPRSSGKTPAQMMSAEAKRIQAAIPDQAIAIVLDEKGRDLTTQGLATQLGLWQDLGQTVALIVGGPDGLDPDLKAQSKGSLRLSSLTLPHPMVRVLLIEQIYRAWSILANHPYHRA